MTKIRTWTKRMESKGKKKKKKRKKIVLAWHDMPLRTLNSTQ